jgi:hypothetical protein
MSLTFNQICSQLDETLGTNVSRYPLADKVIDINLALDAALAIIFAAGGKWKFDDSNNSDYPIITADIVANQRDYTFTNDQDGNLILDINKVFLMRVPSSGGTGVYQEIYPVDPASEEGLQTFTDGLNVVAQPYLYQKLGNGIILNTLPPANVSSGLKMYINREASYFTTSDTTKKPGFAGLFHEYLVLRPAYKYAQRKSLSIAGGVLRNGSMTGLLRDVSQMEQAIKDYYGNRSRDERPKLSPRITRFK